MAETGAINHIIGPQVGGRWTKQWERVRVAAEGRFCPAINFQNVRQTGDWTLVSTVPFAPTPVPNFAMGSLSSTAYTTLFTPVVDLRAEIGYQITSAVELTVGWNGMWMDGIARPTSLVNYQVPGLGINMAHNSQNVFVNGLTLGVVFNH